MNGIFRGFYAVAALMIAVAALFGIVGALLSEPAWPAEPPPPHFATICNAAPLNDGGQNVKCCVVAMTSTLTLVSQCMIYVFPATVTPPPIAGDPA
jgi:hypothetical protein